MESHYLQYLGEGADRNAVLRQLMGEYGNDVWNFAYFLTQRADAADDVSQEVFLSVYKSLFQFRGECSIKSWLLSITRNKSLHYLNSSFLRKVTLIDYVARKEASPSAEAVMFDRMETKQIWESVMDLPRKHREVIVLDAHYELSMREMAELLEIAEGTVKSRLHRARQALSDLLMRRSKEDER